MNRFLAFFLFAGLISRPVHADEKAERDGLLKADRDFGAAAQTRGVEAWVENFAENGVHPDGPTALAIGKDGIRKQMSAQYASPGFRLEWSPANAEVSRGGNIGTTRGRYKVTTIKDGKKKDVREGDYFTVWEKDKNDSWKVVFDTGERDPQPPPRP